MNGNLEKVLSDKSSRNYLPFESVYVEKGSQSLAEELMNDVFEQLQKQETYHVKVSRGDCYNLQNKYQLTEYNDDDMDPRLKCWKKMLRERKVLQDRIERHTGKRAEDVLFNRPSTIDEQTKQMLIRVMDTAERIHGIPPSRVRGVLKMRQDAELCREIRELRPTDPKLGTLEFVGLPKVTQLELAATQEPGESQWQRSQALSARLEAQEKSIMRVLHHCPEVDKLEISSLPTPYTVPVVNSKRMGEDMIYTVSPETSCHSVHDATETVKFLPQPAVFAVKGQSDSAQWTVNNVICINGNNYGFGNSSGILSGEMQLYFQCDPMQHVRKTIAQLENIGDKFIQIRWQQVSLHNKELQQHVPYNNEFLFNMQPFLLLPGEKRRIDIMYQPLIVGVKKQRWCMHLQRSPFCGNRRLYVRFHGVCSQPVCFRERLDLDQRLVVDKRKRQITDRLAKMHAELAPIVERSRLKCPYQRELDERELFSAQNPGFKCVRFADLETLKELYALVKKPRQPAWDYRLATLRQCIYQHEVAQRETLQNILVELLEPMRCSSDENFADMHSNQQRERSCYLYVRGIVCTAVEDWESLSNGLGEQFFKSELQRYVNDLQERNEKMPVDSDYVEWFVSRKVLASKFFKDALYIQTYTLVCDAAENIVSAIESTGSTP